MYQDRDIRQIEPYFFQLLPRLHEVLQRRDENNPIELKLHDMANEIHKVVTMYLQVKLREYFSLTFFLSLSLEIVVHDTLVV